MAAKKNISFEDALEQLEALVEELEDGDLPLEEALAAFEQGIKLTRQCQTALTQAQQKVQQLLEQNNDLQAEDFLTADTENSHDD